MTPWTVAYQTSPSIGLSRQGCWSGLLFPSPGDLPDPGVEPRSPALQADSLLSEPLGKSLSKAITLPKLFTKSLPAVSNASQKNHLGNSLVVQRLGPLTSIGEGTDHWLGKLACRRRSQKSLYQCHFSSSIYQFINSPS